MSADGVKFRVEIADIFRVKNVFFAAIVIAVSFISKKAIADIDPSSALLLKNSSTEGQSGVNLDSGRYTIRPSAAPTPQSTKVESPQSTPKPKPTATTNTNESVNTNTKSSTVAPKAEDTDPFPERMKEFFLGGDMEEILRYRGALHPEDPRHNFVEVSVAPGYLYMNSKSDYWYRKFHSAAPGLGVGAEFWLTPFFSLQSTYFTTFAADMTAQYDSNRKVNTDHRLFNAGIQFRKFFSMSRKSPNLVFGINYDETQLLVPKSEPQRPRLKTTGVALRLEATLPKTTTRAWVVGAEFLPKIKVTEIQTGLDLQSGKKPTSYGFKFSFGQDFNFNRNHKVFWRLSHRIDKTVYEGTATLNDPITGTAPSGVSVTQGTSLFQFGFTWGD